MESIQRDIQVKDKKRFTIMTGELGTQILDRGDCLLVIKGWGKNKRDVAKTVCKILNDAVVVEYQKGIQS